MSDSFNSPNQPSSEQSLESTPEANVTAVNARSVKASATDRAANLEDELENSELDDLEVIKSFRGETSSEESTSFEDIADFIEADMAIETPAENFNEVNAAFDELPASDRAVTQAEDIDASETGEATASAFDASVEVVDVEILESQEQEQSYEVHQDGTLTYFQYFLDEEEATFGPGYGEWRNEAKGSPRSFVSATAVGVGVLAATFGAGLLMAEATNRNTISDGDGDGFESQTKADAGQSAGEAAGLAKASGPESAVPDWSATQKALAVSQGTAQAKPVFDAASAIIPGQPSPASSSVTGKLAPLAQSWGASVPLAPPKLPIAPPPIIATANLPSPQSVSVTPSSGLQPPSYQVIQPAAIQTASASLTPPPVLAELQPEERQLRSRIENLRDRMAEPIDINSVPTSNDGSLLDGSDDDRWVSNVPNQVNVPTDEAGTTLEGALQVNQPSLTDSPYSDSTVASAPQAIPSNVTSDDEGTTPQPIAAAPKAYPLDLSPVVPPHQASSLDEQVVAPVAGLLPNPAMPSQPDPSELAPQTSTAPIEEIEPATQTSDQAIDSQAQASNQTQASWSVQDRAAMEITPGAIALEVIPPSISAPILTAPHANDQAMDNAGAALEQASLEQIQPQSSPEASKQASLIQSHATSEVAVVIPQGITSLTELTELQSARPLALSRNTAREALANADQLPQFRVLPLAVREYQRLWQESGNEGTFAPVHGFVDYGQNVIAVVITRGESLETPNTGVETLVGQNVGDIVGQETLTEVSTQVTPVEALSQS